MRYITRTKGRPASAASWAFRIFDAATICIAFVTRAMLLIEWILRRKSLALYIRSPGDYVQVSLNWSAIDFNAACNAGLRAFSDAICRSSSGFLVPRYSDSLS